MWLIGFVSACLLLISSTCGQANPQEEGRFEMKSSSQLKQSSSTFFVLLHNGNLKRIDNVYEIFKKVAFVLEKKQEIVPVSFDCNLDAEFISKLGIDKLPQIVLIR